MDGGSGTSLNLEYNWTEVNWTVNRKHLLQPSQNFIDASLSYTTGGGQWEVKLCGRKHSGELNLANLIFSGDTTESFDFLLLYHDYVDPRTYGISFTWNYQ